MLQPLLLSVMRGMLFFIKDQLNTLVLHVTAVPGWRWCSDSMNEHLHIIHIATKVLAAETASTCPTERMQLAIRCAK
jgi:hypothetical protein